MYHPAAALHQPSLKTTLERDFSRLTDFIKQAKQQTQPKSVVQTPPPAPAEMKALEKSSEPKNAPPTQLSLF
jgi:DNA polymerase